MRDHGAVDRIDRIIQRQQHILSVRTGEPQRKQQEGE